MKRFFLVMLIACAGVGGWWAWNNYAPFREVVSQYIENGEFVTLEARYSPEQLMEEHRKELLPNSKYTFQDPSVKFFPYLLIDAKYAYGDKGTREGILLWGLTDGEIVLNTDNWERSHGYEDAINANASRSDFKLMFALAKNKGTLSQDQLQKELHLERDIVELWVESAIKKNLIVQIGSQLQLHLENPKLLLTPETKIQHAFVKKPYDHGERMSNRYSQGQILSICKAAFGSGFTIRNTTQIYLPVYCLSVLNPDGSTLISYWNGLTGEQMPRSIGAELY